MRITPSSTINLYANVDNESDERLIFSTRAKQIEYFLSKRVRQEVNCTLVRKSGMLHVEAPMSVVCNCNYISFINPSFDNKEFYGYITNYKYINNECTDISYQIDYWQSYMFDVTFQNMYIEREHLSQADFEKAETNPYDPSIFEFRTAETLPVSKNLEKLTYTVGDSDATDGFKMTRALSNVVRVKNVVGTRTKLSNIDLADLDSVKPGVSEGLADYLVSIVTGSDSLGYFYLPPTMGAYLQSHYSSKWGTSGKSFNNYALGDGWVASGNTPISPLYTSMYQPCCCYLYDQYGGDYVNNNGHMSELIDTLTLMKALDSIIDIKAVPDAFIVLAGKQSASGNPITFAQRTVKSKISVTNKKLMRYPYSYLRIMAPNGDVKELQFERFSNVQGGEDACYISTSLDIADQPTLILAPKNYKMSGISNATGLGTNIFDAILFNQFPSMPYTVDAFLAQVAAVANQTIANRTLDNGWDLAAEQTAVDGTSDIINTLKIGLGAGATGSGFGLDTDRDLNAIDGPRTYVSGAHGVGNLAQGVAKASEGYGYGSNLEARRGKFNAAAERWNEADYALAGADGNAIANQLALAKPAYACDKYYQSNGVGVTNFNNISMMDIIILRVTLDPQIRILYDNWFSHYGYTSGRCGIPRAIQFARGASQDANLPHWVTLNGKETTYVKTMDCKVIHSMLPVASYIKAMLDGGVRFIKGDIAAQNGGN